MTRNFYTELAEKIIKNKLTKFEIMKLKVKLVEKYNLKKIPTDIEVLLNLDSKLYPKLKALQSKPSRTISGVIPIAIMTKPLPCPHGRCIMCPGGLNSVFGDIPQSYTGKEPATMRAIRNDYDAYLQVFNRLEQYVVLGNLPQKIELIIMGGTFPSFKKSYQESFVNDAFKAMNDFSKMFFRKNDFDFKKFKEFFELPGDVYSVERAKNLRLKILKIKNKNKSTLKQSQNYNDKISQVKCVGLTIETRPDYGLLAHGNFMLKLGATRVELGVQSVYDDVLKYIERGHNTKTTKQSIRILKDLGFKLNFHYMPGLPKTPFNKDLEGMKKLFSDEDYRPDMLKIYPCMVMPGTKLAELYNKKKFTPLTTEKAASLIARFKKYVPEYVRIMRVQRDIPTKQTIAGVDRTNLRQYVDDELRKLNIKCRCIRCREIKSEHKIKNPELKIIKYDASKGKEFFISLEENDKLIGFIRMRFPSQCLRKEITKDSALIRELHVYGQPAVLGEKGSAQHRGFGKLLLKEAEKIAKNHKKTKILVISGIGVRNYYRKQGYELEGPYMTKYLI